MFRLYLSTFQVILCGKEVKIKQNMLGISFVKINCFLSYIFPVLEFHNFWGSESEFLVSSFLQKNACL